MREDSIDILAWKFNDTPGVTTVNGHVRDWPESLGPLPTEAQIDAWGAEYDAAMAAIAAAEQAKIDKKLADILATLPTWDIYKADLNALIDAAQAANTLNKLQKVVVNLCQRYKKDAKVLYWLAKETDD